MSTLTGQVDWESPWVFGVILFAVYIATELFTGWLFGDGLADVSLAGAVAFAGVAIVSRILLNRYTSES